MARVFLRRAQTLLLLLLLGGCALDDGFIIPGTSGASSGRSSSDLVVAGLQEALRVGTERAVSRTSQRGGFLNNPLLRIALPDQLNAVVDTLNSIGLGSLVDSFETTMNRAAERAAGEATPVFVNALSQLTWRDANAILNGGPTAATDYFRARTSQALTARFRPIIEDSMNQFGLYGLYKDFITPYQQLPFTESINLDLADYVTRQTLSGLFTALGEEEARIRQDPLARTTEILRQVFSG